MAQLTNNTRKLYSSLSSTKGRKDSGLFMAQGEKCVADTIEYFEVHTIIANAQWIDRHKDIEEMYDITPAKNADLERISTLSNPPDVIAVYKIPQIDAPRLDGQLAIALDTVQDPGNLGTIMRVADWMGITSIIASKETVDVWSPKVVQATMGAISRVNVYYTDLDDFFTRHSKLPVYGTLLDGENIYDSDLKNEGIILMGNEGKGISASLRRHITHRLFIPPYPAGNHTSESLNVAVATAITVAEFRRQAAKR